MYRLFWDYRARWGWSSWCCFRPGYWPHNCRGQRLKAPHQAAADVSPVHRAAGCGEGTAAGHPLSKSELEGGHPALHRLMSPRSPGLLWLAPLVQRDPHLGALRKIHTVWNRQIQNATYLSQGKSGGGLWLWLYLGPGHHSWARPDQLDCVPHMCRLQSQTAAQEKSFIKQRGKTWHYFTYKQVIFLETIMFVFSL